MASDQNFTNRVCECTSRLALHGVDALGSLFDLTSDRLVRLAVAITRNQHDAEDCVQTILVRIVHRPALITSTLSPWPYLLRMVRNEALLVGRRRRARRVCSGIIDLVTRRNVDELELEDTHRQVWAALRSLPTEQAEVVVLKIWEGLTFNEISQILEISANTVASRYQYAITKLSKRLGRELVEVRRG